MDEPLIGLFSVSVHIWFAYSIYRYVTKWRHLESELKEILPRSQLKSLKSMFSSDKSVGILTVVSGFLALIFLWIVGENLDGLPSLLYLGFLVCGWLAIYNIEFLKMSYDVIHDKQDAWKLWEVPSKKKQYKYSNSSQDDFYDIPENDDFDFSTSNTRGENHKQRGEGGQSSNGNNQSSEYDFDAARWDKSRFDSERHEKKYQSIYRAAHDPKTAPEERKRYFSGLVDADSGKMKGIKALPAPN